MARSLTPKEIEDRFHSVEDKGRFEFIRVSDKPRHIILKCSCGNIRDVRLDSFVKGDSKSCGCLAKEKMRERVSTKGGRTKHPLFQAWYDMNRRCFYPSRKDYHHYGGRGITVCARWSVYNDEGFSNFLADVGTPPFEKAELDRVDNNGNYGPDNFKWSTRREQTNNHRWNMLISAGGFTMTLAEWGYFLGVRPNLIRDRIVKLKWEDDVAVSTPFTPKYRHLLVDGEKTTIGKFLAEHKIGLVTFYNRKDAKIYTDEEWLSWKTKKYVVDITEKKGRNFQEILDFLNGEDVWWADDYCKSIRSKYKTMGGR